MFFFVFWSHISSLFDEDPNVSWRSTDPRLPRQDHLNALTNVMATYAGYVPSQDKKPLMNPQKEYVYGLNPIISMLSTARWWHTYIYIYIYWVLLHWIPLYLHCNHLYPISPISPLHPQSNPKISPLHLYYALFSLINNRINNIPIKFHPLYISSQSQCSISPQYPHFISQLKLLVYPQVVSP